MNLRDMRDPALFGERYLRSRTKGVDIETACNLIAPDFNETSSTGVETQERYKREKTEEAAQGNRAAGVVCDEHGWAYGIAQNDSQDVHAPDKALHMGPDLLGLEMRVCNKQRDHDPHAWSVVPQPGTRVSVALYACPGLGAEDDIY